MGHYYNGWLFPRAIRSVFGEGSYQMDQRVHVNQSFHHAAFKIASIILMI